MNSLLFAVVTFALWISPVVVIVALVRIARRVGIDLSRQPPPTTSTARGGSRRRPSRLLVPTKTVVQRFGVPISVQPTVPAIAPPRGVKLPA
jgi:hypothetical protein